MNSFNQLAKKNPWWKILFNINKVPVDFPQVKIGSRTYPIVFYSHGSLTLFERQLDFKASPFDSITSARYFNLNNTIAFEVEFSYLKIDRYLNPNPFLKAFNIPWIKLSASDNQPFNHILVSYGAEKIKMSEVKKVNNEIFEILKDKINSYN